MLVAVSAGDAWLELIGRLHPILVHFPIGLAVAACVVEMWRAFRREPGPSEFALTCIWFAALSGVATATSGWFNAQYENDSQSLTLFLHRWLGIAAAALMLVLAVSGTVIRRRRESNSAGGWRTGLLAAAVGVGITGHFGGAMVYGDEYLSEAFWSALEQTEQAQRDAAEDEARAKLGLPPKEVQSASTQETAVLARAPKDPQTVDFAKVIVPILETRCYECHGKGKKKGGVRLDDWGWMRSEHKGEWVVKPFETDSSTMMKFITLSPDDEDRMPPEGDPLTDIQIEQIRTWIAEGAFVGDVPSPGAVSDNRWTIPERTLTPDELARVNGAQSQLEKVGVRVVPIAQGSSNYEANGSLATPPVGNAAVSSLEPLAGVLVSLNLSRSDINDECASAISKLRELRTLRIDQTKVTDAIVPALVALPNLTTLNCVSTGLTDAGLAQLEGAMPLRKLFVWSSKVTPEGIARFRLKRPDVILVAGLE